MYIDSSIPYRFLREKMETGKGGPERLALANGKRKREGETQVH